jgi:predicted GNAT family N-acyltransferase
MTGFAVARKTAPVYQWRLVASAGCTEADPSALRELSEFRGRILYAEGRRPGFQRNDGRYADDDPLDSQSFHITVRTAGGLVGYTRIRPLPDEYAQSSLGRLVTKGQLEAVLKEMRLVRHDCLEVSRWIVAPSARGTAVAPTLVVSAWAVGKWLGKRRLLATVGARDGQVTMLARFGGQVLQSVNAKFIAEYDDELAMMHFDLNCPPPRVTAKLSAVRRLLQLADSPLDQSESGRHSCFSPPHLLHREKS